jgi:predicted Zn-dependent protease with MMP-like domain
MNEKPHELESDAEEHVQSPEDDAAEAASPEGGNAAKDALEDGDEDLLLEYDEDLEGEDGAAEPEEWIVTWPLHLETAEFDQLVSDVMDGLPEEWTPILENMAVVVENEPPDDEVPEDEGEVFGAFRATSAIAFLGGGLAGQAASAPPEVALFQGPLERASASVDELRERVHATLVHEIGRRFGYGDEDFADDDEEYDEGEDEAEDALESDEALEGNDEPGELKDAG